MKPISEVAGEVGLAEADLFHFGPHIAKLSARTVRRLSRAPVRGRLVLVSATTPAGGGEGKTTVAIGLAQALRGAGHSPVLALRQPSLAPVFGIKGGATGCGGCRLEPSTRIDLHFTGDLHAIESAHNLLAALVDNALHFKDLDVEPRAVLWSRVIDVNDRALRKIVVGLAGDGMAHATGFEVAAASEVMAALCLAADVADLKVRLGNAIVAVDGRGDAVRARSLQAQGAMAALLSDAVLPNLVQSTDGVPAFVHGGPFGNIAHGCSSVVGTRCALALGDYAITEAGFGFDLGGEKFLDIKCRAAKMWPDAVVLVTTAASALAHGLDNLRAHVNACRGFGLEPVVALNVFAGDDEANLAGIERACGELGLHCARVWPLKGAAGCEQLAALVQAACGRSKPEPRFAYELDAPIEDKVNAVAQRVYGAYEATFSRQARAQADAAWAYGGAALPVCIAKTQKSLTADPERVGAPRNFSLPISEVRLRAAAGYVLAVAGDTQTMPGLPKKPRAAGIDVDAEGKITGV